jgi:tetratricopeptide (TPR) repeat protein
MSNVSITEELIHAEEVISEGKIDEGLALIYKVEQKTGIYSLKGELNKALDVLLKCKVICEKVGHRNSIAYNYFSLGNIYLQINDFNNGLDYGMKCLSLWEELRNHKGIAAGLSLVGRAYNYKGKLDLAIEYCKRSLSIKEMNSIVKVGTLYILGVIYFWKGEYQQSIKYQERSLSLAEEKNFETDIALNLNHLGITYLSLGEYDNAIKYQERSLMISEKIGFTLIIGMSLFGLIYAYDLKGSLNQASDYLSRLKTITEQKKKNKFLIHTYMVSKTFILKSSGRSRDRAEAEILLKQIVEDKISNPAIYIAALTNLVIILFEELRISKNLEILDELNPLLTRFHNISEKMHSYMFIAQGKLFEAKLALIELNFKKAKKLLTEAQRVAELRGFHILAQEISSEHDLFLRQQDIWNNYSKTNVPISDRINLATFDGVLDQIRGMRSVEPPELENESPILLLIISEGGILIFSYPFTAEWRRDDELFSSFLSAFTSFSAEYFSEELDRAKFGDFTVLLETIDDFSVCYLYKGQTYPAKQKLTKFIETLQKDPSIIRDLNDFSKTSQVLEIKDNSSLEILIKDIFIKYS